MRSDYHTKLLRDDALLFHIRNLQLLVTEVYKTKWELRLSFLKEIFVEKLCRVKRCYYLLLSHVRNTCNTLETISFGGCRLWQALPNDMKQSKASPALKGK